MSRHYGYPMSDGKTPGELIREWRDANHLTQEQLALKLGVSQRTLSRWETNEHLPQPKVWKALRELGIALPEKRGQLRAPDEVTRRLVSLEERLGLVEVRLDDAATREELRLFRDLLQRLADDQDDPEAPG